MNNFEPKFKYVTPAERKFSEFVTDKVGQKKELNNSLVNVKKKETPSSGEKLYKDMTANERKLKTFHPDKSLMEIEKIKKRTTVLDEIPEKNCKISVK